MRSPDFTVDQEDGAIWSVYNDSHHTQGFTIITSAGAALLNNPAREAELRGLVHRYHVAEMGSVALLGADPEIRQELGRGQEAVVYRMGPYAVREEVGIKDFYPALGELQRMDAINGVIEEGLPRWINLPAHYARHVDPRRQKTYTLMHRVDGGVTAEDILDYPNVPKHRAVILEKEMGAHVGDAQKKVPELYERTYQELACSIEKLGRDPAHYLTDWKPRNVVVQRLETPVAGVNYSMSVIDQYRA